MTPPKTLEAFLSECERDSIRVIESFDIGANTKTVLLPDITKLTAIIRELKSQRDSLIHEIMNPPCISENQDERLLKIINGEAE